MTAGTGTPARHPALPCRRLRQLPLPRGERRFDDAALLTERRHRQPAGLLLPDDLRPLLPRRSRSGHAADLRASGSDPRCGSYIAHAITNHHNNVTTSAHIGGDRRSIMSSGGSKAAGGTTFSLDNLDTNVA